MSPDAAARLTLALYALVAAGVVAAQIALSGVGLVPWCLYAVSRAYTDLLFHWRAERRCPFPQSGGALIIANHRSPVDPQIIWTNHHLGPRGAGPLRIISFVTAREYCDLRGLRWLFRALRAVPVSRDGRDTRPAKEMLTRLKSGELLCLFPEGGINTGPGLRPFDSGVAWLALRAKVPVYPVFIHGSPQGESMIAPFFRPCRVRVSYGDPIDLSRWHADRSRTALEDATDLLRQRLGELGGLTPAPARRTPG